MINANLNCLIANANNYKSLTANETKNLLNTRFSTALDLYINDNVTFLRLDNVKENFILYTPNERISRIKNNNSIFLYSILPSWKNYPKRNRSICMMDTDNFEYDFGNYNPSNYFNDEGN